MEQKSKEKYFLKALLTGYIIISPARDRFIGTYCVYICAVNTFMIISLKAKIAYPKFGILYLRPKHRKKNHNMRVETISKLTVNSQLLQNYFSNAKI